MDELTTGLLKHWIILNSCLLVLVSAMDCDPRVQLFHICMFVQEWIPESKIPQVFFTGSKMNKI